MEVADLLLLHSQVTINILKTKTGILVKMIHACLTHGLLIQIHPFFILIHSWQLRRGLEVL